METNISTITRNLAANPIPIRNMGRSAYGMYVSYHASVVQSTTDWTKKYCEETGTANGMDTRHDLPYDHIVHVIIVPNYKEDMETLCETLDILASHSRAMTQYKICMAMEESEQGAAEKGQTLMKMYINSFFDITYTIHPVGRPGEIRGKSSNVAWAACEMARRGGNYHEHEIVTVMDADSAFAEDYFAAVTYHYAIASPAQRRIMMFAPCTVFDRNSNHVPVFVRVTDMFWSIGVMSNLYSSSPVKIPCSAYSVSMDLCIAVNFWDPGPEAIGEDLHMYLKCFFCTEGNLIVKSIFSPASQCNVEGDGGNDWAGFRKGLSARYVQAKRHLWGSLDTGYSLRRALLGILAPGFEKTIELRNLKADKIGKGDNEKNSFDFVTLCVLFHRLLEAHILMGHMFLLILTAWIILPVKSSLSYGLAASIYSYISSETVHPYVEWAINTSFWVRMACVIPNLIMIYYYELYHSWVGFERWALQSSPEHREIGIKVLTENNATIKASHVDMKVQHLGRRAVLSSYRVFPKNLIDWLTIPAAGFMFYVAPQIDAQISQLWTDRLDYKVAAKPQLNRPSPPSPPAATVIPLAAKPVSHKIGPAAPLMPAEKVQLPLQEGFMNMDMDIIIEPSKKRVGAAAAHGGLRGVAGVPLPGVGVVGAVGVVEELNAASVGVNVPSPAIPRSWSSDGMIFGAYPIGAMTLMMQAAAVAGKDVVTTPAAAQQTNGHIRQTYHGDVEADRRSESSGSSSSSRGDEGFFEESEMDGVAWRGLQQVQNEA
ncbi:hypothetical protein HDU76_004883 [Blyttiomyces sp. JEL0837]|nr:hypothetical protein HDU76_004883 [Blyttiomyces sp. JEL0837]